MPASTRFDLPVIEDDTRAFWNATRDRRLVLRSCRACGRAHHYPRPFCPFCWSDDVEWIEASGAATLYTWSTVYRNDLPPFHEQVPYVAAVVDLAEGPRMMTRVVGCEPDEISIGMALTIDFVDIDDEVTIVVFRPAG